MQSGSMRPSGLSISPLGNTIGQVGFGEGVEPPIQLQGSPKIPSHLQGRGGNILSNNDLIASDISWLHQGPLLLNSDPSFLEIKTPVLREDLKRISFYELFNTTPSIHQLFNPDFKEVIANLVTLQEDSILKSKIEPKRSSLPIFENIQLDSGTHTDKNISNIESLATNAGATQNSDINQNNAYNHLLYSPQESKQRQEATAPPQRKRSNNPKGKEKEPYFDRKKRSKKESISQNMLRGLVKGLNSASRNLSKYLE